MFCNGSEPVFCGVIEVFEGLPNFVRVFREGLPDFDHALMRGLREGLI